MDWARLLAKVREPGPRTLEFLKQLIAENDSPIAEPWCNRALEHCRALRDDECFKYLGMALTYVAARKAGV
jgi:hypothetical protein